MRRLERYFIEHPPKNIHRNKQRSVNNLIVKVLQEKNQLSSSEIFQEIKTIDDTVKQSNIKKGIRTLRNEGKINLIPDLEDMRRKRFFIPFNI